MTRAIELDLTRLTLAYKMGTVTPSAVIDRILSCIAERGDDGIWLSLVPVDHIIDRVATLEAMGPDERAKYPLWGIPFAIKDNIDLAGCPTTAACPSFAYMPKKSADCVERLIQAGAIPIGKTNLDQFATGLVGTRTPGKAPVNPFDRNFVSGGSSSGSAAALAHGLVSFALGTDTAGSGRVPAGLCNLVGLKPTIGRISTEGLVPASRSIDCISVFAFTMPDAIAVLRVIELAPAPISEAKPPIGQKFRFGIPSTDQRLLTADADAEAGFLEAIEQLKTLGGEPVDIDFAPLTETASLLYGPLVAERLADLEKFLATQRSAVCSVTRHIIEAGTTVSGSEVYRAQHRVAELGKVVAQYWNEIDFIVVPTYPKPVSLVDIKADPIGPNSMLGTYTNFVNLLNLSAIAVPAGFRTDGLPHGITLIGPAFAEDRLAPLAGRFHQRTGLSLGATSMSLPDATIPDPEDASIPVAVFGAHLSGERLNQQLLGLGGWLVRPCRTAPAYRLFGLPDGRPGLIRQPAGGAAIEWEIWRLPAEGFGRFTAAIPTPLGIGRVLLEDGHEIPGFLCEPYAVETAPDITRFGGWRAWRASLAKA